MPKETERKDLPARKGPRDKPLTDKLKERLEGFVQDILDTLGGLATPEPELVPIPVRGRPRPYRR